MPGQRFNPTLLCLLPFWMFITVVSCYPNHSTCRLIQRMALCNEEGLSSVPVDLPDTIEELYLNHNTIQTLQNYSISSYPSLSTLSLAGNNLEALDAMVFHNSVEITSLNLADNSLHTEYHRTSVALLALNGLRILDLSENGLTDSMASILLLNLTSLEYLNLSGNLLLRLDESSLKDLHQLKELDLQKNMLFEIDNAFENTPKLQRLNLAFNYLPCLVAFQMTQLIVLNASHNAIEWFIANQTVDDTFNLETLDLTDNKLLFFPFLPTHSRLQNLYLSQNRVSFYEHLDDNATFPNLTRSVEFYNLKGSLTNVTAQLWEEGLHGDISSLVFLDLSQNQVAYFPQGFIRKMPALSRLRLGTNCLKVLNINLEQLPASLYELDVSNNRLTEVVADQATLKLLGNLTYFNLRMNDLQRLPLKLFSSLQSLRSVDISYNGVGICSSEVDIEHKGNYSDCLVWKNMFSLRQLYLSGCDLGRIHLSAFTGTPLTHLELSDNPKLIIEPGSMNSLSSSLQHLNLGNTGIQTLDFSPFQNLKSLNISRNCLSILPRSLMELELHVLDLRDNKLTYISSDQANVLAPKLKSIFLLGNKFNCCQLEWYIIFKSTKTINIVGQSDIACQDLAKRTHRLTLFDKIICGDMNQDSILWYLVFFVPVCLSLLGITFIYFLTFNPRLLPKTIKKKCWRPIPY
ncbi:transforming growth factor beta activator LRRC33 [Aplochiton taeniatus]